MYFALFQKSTSAVMSCEMDKPSISSGSHGEKRYCCNTFHLTHTIAKSLRKITTDTAAKMKTLTGQDVEGMLCPSCRIELISRIQRHTSAVGDNNDSSNDNSSGEELAEVKTASATKIVDTAARAFSVSPFKFRKVNGRDSRGYAVRKTQELKHK